MLAIHFGFKLWKSAENIQDLFILGQKERFYFAEKKKKIYSFYICYFLNFH